MTEREQVILNLYKGKMTKKYGLEATFLNEANEFISLFKNLVKIRETSATVNGVADLIMCYNGRFVAAELKKEFGVATQQQLNFIKAVRGAGGIAGECRSLADIWNLLSKTAQ